MKLFFTSKALANEAQQKDFLTFVESRRKVSIMTTASEHHKEKNRNTVELKKKLDTLGFDVAFVDVEFDQAELLIDSEIVIITGGNPYYLLHHLKKSNAIKILEKLIERNTPIMGVSAGIFVFMKDLNIVDLLTPEMNTIGLADKRGLGKIDEVVIPHYDRFINEGKIKKLEIDSFEKKSVSKVIRLGEFQTLKYRNDVMELSGEIMK